MTRENPAPNPKGRGGITRAQILEQVERVRNYKVLGATNEQIRQNLNLTQKSLDHRIHMMNIIDRKVLEERFSNLMFTEVRVLENRLLRTIANCEQMANDRDHIAPEIRLEAERLKVDVSVSLLKLFLEGPVILNKNAVKIVERAEQQLKEIRHSGGLGEEPAVNEPRDIQEDIRRESETTTTAEDRERQQDDEQSEEDFR